MEVAPDKLLQVCESLLPPGVALRHLRELDQASDLFDQERLQVANFAEKRRQEFRAGRCCARRALAELGVEACAIPSGPDRAPVWPDGIVGSISHSEGHAVAVVARQDACRGIGVDIEARDRVGADVWTQIATASERDALARLSVSASREQATRLFSSKEAFYKAQFQITGGWLGFQDASVLFDGSAFELTLSVDVENLASRGTLFRGEQRYIDGCVLSLVWIS